MSDLTHEQHVILNTWAQFGAAHFVRKLRGGRWIIAEEALGARFPVVYRTKRDAMAQVDAYILLKSHEWRGITA